MLATLVIGLREGLEAALIVGILAAFLKRNGHSLRAMWVGVIAAVLLSIGVGTVLEIVAVSLPQAQQEGLETVIGAVAVVFVTGMIVWMNGHAAGLRRELEAEATAALGAGSAIALAVMAFLAVLKEGFETSVFLLATFQSSTSVIAAIAGAAIGILVSVGIGVGIYHGGVRLNLGRFFRITGVFLIFVAAGLVLSALRTAHEAGWLTIGQQRTVDLTWLAPNGSIQSALLTGVLGIPSDPRLVEVLGWAIYLVVVLVYVFWPVTHHPTGRAAVRTRLGIAAGLGVAAIVLAIAVPLAPTSNGDSTMPLADSSGVIAGGVSVDPDGGYAITLTGGTVTSNPSKSISTQHQGVDAVERSLVGAQLRDTSTLTIDQLVGLNEGRLPIGMSVAQSPGPFTVITNTTTDVTVWTVGKGILDAAAQSTDVLTISGGGLPSPRTVSIDRPAIGGDPATVAAVTARATNVQLGNQELLLWKLYLPIAALIAALALCTSAARARRRIATTVAPSPVSEKRNTSYVS